MAQIVIKTVKEISKNKAWVERILTLIHELDRDQVQYGGEDTLGDFPTEDECTKIAVAIENGEIVGFISYDDDPEISRARVDMFYVIPECRGKGIGTKLMTTVLKDMRKSVHKEVILMAYLKNHNSQRLYMSLGFHHEYVLACGECRLKAGSYTFEEDANPKSYSSKCIAIYKSAYASHPVLPVGQSSFYVCNGGYVLKKMPLAKSADYFGSLFNLPLLKGKYLYFDIAAFTDKDVKILASWGFVAEKLWMLRKL